MSQLNDHLRILVADDSPVSRKQLEHAFLNQPYEVLFAKDGREALTAVSHYRPHIVITDWMMPDLSGPELCQKIRNELQDGYTYIILLTSNAEKDSVVEGLAAGADDYLTKPFHVPELLARIGVGHRIIEMNREIQAKNRLLEEAARTDPLTGLPNRRAVEEYAAKQLLGALRHGFSLWVIAVDLDKFKLVNDSHGHAAGDAVLRRFAKLLKANTRASDICGRMGGDEFILVMTHVDRRYIVQTIERLRADFAREEFEFLGKKIRVTASFGLTGFQGAGAPEFHQLLARADRALYGAKVRGRNQINVELPSRSDPLSQTLAKH